MVWMWEGEVTVVSVLASLFLDMFSVLISFFTPLQMFFLLFLSFLCCVKLAFWWWLPSWLVVSLDGLLDALWLVHLFGLLGHVLFRFWSFQLTFKSLFYPLFDPLGVFFPLFLLHVPLLKNFFRFLCMLCLVLGFEHSFLHAFMMALVAVLWSLTFWHWK